MIFILVHLAVFVRPVSSLHSMCSGNSFFFWLPMCWWEIFIYLLKYLICFFYYFFYLIDYINGNKRCFLLLQILIRKKLLNDGGGLPPDRGLPWQWTGVPTGICGKAYGIFLLFCNTDMTCIIVDYAATNYFLLLRSLQIFTGKRNLLGCVLYYVVSVIH